MARRIIINGGGSVSGGTYTTSGTELPASTEMTWGGDLNTTPDAAWDALPEPRNVFEMDGFWANRLEHTYATGLNLGLSSRFLFVLRPQTANPDAMVGMRNIAATSDARVRVFLTGGQVRIAVNWNAGESYLEANTGEPGTVPICLEFILDLANPTQANRIQWRRWNLGDLPGAFSDPTGGSGPAATAENHAFDNIDGLWFGEANNPKPDLAFGLFVVDDDPAEDLSLLVTGSAGAALTLPTATSITQTTATIGCTSDTATGLVHAGVTTTATPPSDAQLIAGTGGGLIAAGSVSAAVGANTVGLTGLTANTGYFRHFIQSDGGVATSTMFSPDDPTAGFTTLAAATGPTIINNTATALTTGGFTLNFETNTNNGTAYYVVYPDGTTPPDAPQIRDGLNGLGAAALAFGSIPITTTGAQSFSATTGLDPGVIYDYSIVHYGNPA